MYLRTYDSGALPLLTSVLLEEAAPVGVEGGVEEGVDRRVDVPCFDAPTTPPTTAARIMIIRINAKMTQKTCRRRPYILFSLGLAAWLVLDDSTVDGSEERGNLAKALISTSAMDSFSGSTLFSVVSLARVSS